MNWEGRLSYLQRRVCLYVPLLHDVPKTAKFWNEHETMR